MSAGPISLVKQFVRDLEHHRAGTRISGKKMASLCEKSNADLSTARTVISFSILGNQHRKDP
jgi:hypothetical protein